MYSSVNGDVSTGAPAERHQYDCVHTVVCGDQEHVVHRDRQCLTEDELEADGLSWHELCDALVEDVVICGGASVGCQWSCEPVGNTFDLCL